VSVAQGTPPIRVLLVLTRDNRSASGSEDRCVVTRSQRWPGSARTRRLGGLFRCTTGFGGGYSFIEARLSLDAQSIMSC
jgi:hypothetical protein